MGSHHGPLAGHCGLYYGTMANFIRRVLRRIWGSIFQPAARYPADPRAVFILALSVFSGLVALTVEAAPPTLEATLPRWGVIIWGILLCGGSAITLLGMARPTLNGILIEQVGSITVSATTLFYSTLAFVIIGMSALQSVGIIMAWGLSCIIRWIQLQALLVDSFRKGKIINYEKALEKSHDHMRGE